MQTVGIDIGTTTISGVVLEKNGTQKPGFLKQKQLKTGAFLQRQRTGKGSRMQKRL